MYDGYYAATATQPDLKMQRKKKNNGKTNQN